MNPGPRLQVAGRCTAFVAVCCALVSFSPAAFCQVTAREGMALDSTLERARAFLDHDEPDSARVLFSHVLAQRWKPRAAQIGLVQAAIAAGDWSEGISVCRDVLSAHRDDLQARYYIGVCLRESGHPAEAASHFRAIQEQDSLYHDVLYQLALVREEAGEFTEAIDIGVRAAGVYPDSPAVLVGLLRILRHYIASTEYPEALAWLGARTDWWSKFAMGELLRRKGRYPEAGDVFLRLRKPTGPERPLCDLSLARISAALGEDSAAEAWYQDAVDRTGDRIAAGVLFDDLKYIVTDGELAHYRRLATDEERRTFFTDFWEVRRPLYSSRVNQRLVEHFRRYAEAERQFEYFGNRSEHRNPDQRIQQAYAKSGKLNRELNDKGEIFIRLGPPDQKIERSGLEAAQLRDPPSGTIYGALYLAEETWIYHEKDGGPRQIFEFMCLNMRENYWALISAPQNPGMQQDLALWDVRYTQTDLPQVAAELEEHQLADAREGLTTDRYAWGTDVRTFSVPHAVDAFRAGQEKTLVEIAYAIPLADLPAEGAGIADSLRLEVGLSILALSDGSSDGRLDTLVFSPRQRAQGAYIGSYRRTLPRDSVRIAMQVRELGNRWVGTWDAFLRVPRYPGDDFAVSDLELLLPSGLPSSIAIEGLKVAQSPFSVYRTSSRVYAYLQIYNLVGTLDGTTRYTSSYSLVPKGSRGPEDVISLGEVTKETGDAERADFHQLELSAVPPGSYRLVASVTDRNRHATLVRSKDIEITR